MKYIAYIALGVGILIGWFLPMSPQMFGGTVIATFQGGTGHSSFTASQILYGNDANALNTTWAMTYTVDASRPTFAIGDVSTTSIELQISPSASGSWADLYGQNQDGSGYVDLYAATTSQGNSHLDVFDDKGEIFLSPGANSYLLTSANFGFGTTTPMSYFQVTTPSSNATTSVELGKASQTKGTCLVMYSASGVVKYVSIQGSTLTVSAVTCK